MGWYVWVLRGLIVVAVLYVLASLFETWFVEKAIEETVEEEEEEKLRKKG